MIMVTYIILNIFFNLLKKKNNIQCKLLKWHSESNCSFAGYAKIESELSVLGKKKKKKPTMSDL